MKCQICDGINFVEYDDGQFICTDCASTYYYIERGIRKIPQLCNGCQGENFTRTTQYDVCTDCGVCHPYFISDWINYTKDWIYRKSIYRRKTPA